MARLMTRTAVAVGALAAFLATLGAGSASAMTLCPTPGLFTFCTGKPYLEKTPMKLVNLGKAKFEVGIATIECTASTLEGETTSDGGGPEESPDVKFPKRSFTDCTDSKGNKCTVDPLRTQWTGGFYGSGNVDGNLLFDNEFKFTCGADWCVAENYNLNDGIVKGGNPAKIEIKLETLTLRQQSTAKCVQYPTWTVTYEVNTPAPMYVTET